MSRRLPAEITSGGERLDVPVSPPFQLCDRCERGQGDYRSVAPTPVETTDDRYVAWRDYLARWSLRYPCRFEIRARRDYLTLDEIRGHSPGPASPQLTRSHYLRIVFLYPDERDSRDGVSPMPPATGLWPPSLLPDDDTPRWLRANLLYHLAHELDEHLLLDGERVFDPHVRAIYTCEACLARDALLSAAEGWRDAVVDSHNGRLVQAVDALRRLR